MSEEGGDGVRVAVDKCVSTHLGAIDRLVRLILAVAQTSFVAKWNLEGAAVDAPDWFEEARTTIRSLRHTVILYQVGSSHVPDIMLYGRLALNCLKMS